MKKLTLISLSIFTALSTFSSTPNAPVENTATINLEQEKAQWQATQHQLDLTRLAQRDTFLQVENLLRSAVKNQQFSENTQQIVQNLISSLKDYPLQNDLLVRFWETKLRFLPENNPQAAQQAINGLKILIQENRPFITSALQNLLLNTLLKQQQWNEAIELANIVKPKKLEDQLAILYAQYRLASEQLSPTSSPEIQAKWANINVFGAFEELWMNNAVLPENPLQKEWETLTGSDYKRLAKAQYLFEKNDVKGLREFIPTIADKEIQNAAKRLQNLAENPRQLESVIAQANPENLSKSVLMAAFPRYLKTLLEQMSKPDFARFQSWTETWQLSTDELSQWKIAFLTRFFDNDDPDFQRWRDAQIPELRADNLTERRLRMAIWQKTDLSPWLAALSDEAKNKQEWRYWAAKQDPQKTTEKFTALAKERGFYPMLAAAQLKQPYQVSFPAPLTFSENEQAKFEPTFAMIAELRALDRNGLAKQRWRMLLDDSDFETQLKLTQYAQAQQWHDLAVDGTIAAKAWDYLSLRLPNAYPIYFDTALQNLAITKTFAMAIARQESGWNPMAQSSANARGLMQLLPSTAKHTAENSQLPYQGEQDLFKPLNNILLGTAHLNELNAKYPDNRVLIAAAYNAGASRVEKWLARANGKLALDEFVASIPFYETRGYVQNVVAYDFYYQILQQKENPQTFSQVEWDRLY